MPPTYLAANSHFDYESEEIQNLVKKIEDGDADASPLDFAHKAYYYIRDQWSYNPYRFSLIENDWRASHISTRQAGHCLDKAILLSSVLRAKNIPARLGLAKVKNHIAVEILLKNSAMMYWYRTAMLNFT